MCGQYKARDLIEPGAIFRKIKARGAPGSKSPEAYHPCIDLSSDCSHKLLGRTHHGEDHTILNPEAEKRLYIPRAGVYSIAH